MAAEALDIKTLTTLIMASPKTDVTQSIGRILRTKHTQPTVIDIADTMMFSKINSKTHHILQNKITPYIFTITTLDCTKI